MFKLTADRGTFLLLVPTHCGIVSECSIYVPMRALTCTDVGVQRQGAHHTLHRQGPDAVFPDGRLFYLSHWCVRTLLFFAQLVSLLTEIVSDLSAVCATHIN